MNKFRILIFCISFIFCINHNIKAQFNTIKKEPKLNYVIIEREVPEKQKNINISEKDKSIINPDTVVDKKAYREIREKARGRKLHRKKNSNSTATLKISGLTIKSLYEEILKNNIKHPKIVLAQAILETGWFKSSVCRYKGNLFGLTNPKTGQYYEFNDWRESVKAYYDKVQYKYKGGNYLLWLKQIGYAEDPRYVSSVMDVLEKHIL